VASFTPLPLYPRNLLDRRLDGPQSRSDDRDPTPESNSAQRLRARFFFRRKYHRSTASVVYWSEVPPSLVKKLRSYWEEKVAAPIYKSNITAVGIRHHLSAKFGTNFADKRWSLSRHSSFADSGHADFLCCLWQRSTICSQYVISVAQVSFLKFTMSLLYELRPKWGGGGGGIKS
jgi:hypothetical protein